MTGGVVGDGVGEGVGVGVGVGAGLAVGLAGVFEGTDASTVAPPPPSSGREPHPMAGAPTEATRASRKGRRLRSRRGNRADTFVTEDLLGKSSTL
jgi:hypothetical protein